MENTKTVNMPQYQCHKRVWAHKIRQIDSPTGSDVIITPVDSNYEPFHVSHDFIDKHRPQVSGYYVRYEDGYESYSPEEPFESGYTLIAR